MTTEGPAAADERPPPTRRRRLIFLGTSAGLFVLALWLFAGVLFPFALAILLAYVLAPVVSALERVRLGRRATPRWLAVLVLFVALLGGLAGFSALGVPRLAAEVQRLAQDAPALVRRARQEWLPTLEQHLRDTVAAYGPSPEAAEGEADRASAEPPRSSGLRVVPLAGGGFAVELPPRGLRVRREGEGYRILADDHGARAGGDMAGSLMDAFAGAIENAEEHTVTILKTAQGVITSVVRGVFGFFITLMIAAYLLITSDRIFAFARSLWRPERHADLDRLLQRLDRGLAGVVRGQLFIMAVNGILSGIGFYLLDLRYWPVLTLIATVLSIIPIFGAILSSVPAVVIALQGGITPALAVLAWIVGIHQIEANLLNPKIMGDAAKVHPVLVVFALIAGEHVYGISGALLAVPALSILQSVFLHYRETVLGVPAPPLPASSRPPPR